MKKKKDMENLTHTLRSQGKRRIPSDVMGSTPAPTMTRRICSRCRTRTTCNQSISVSQPAGAGILPIWMPVRVS